LGKTLGSARHKHLVKFLIAKRESAQMTQAELADKLGEYQSFVARLESGQRRIDVIELIALSAILGFDPAKAIKRIENVDG
jgi:transcriptional regulator with XRE-family HTH domain